MLKTSVFRLLLLMVPNAYSHVNCVLIIQSANQDVVQVMVVAIFAEFLVKMNLESLSMKSLNLQVQINLHVKKRTARRKGKLLK